MRIEIQIDFDGPTTHICTSHQDGDWVVFKCPLCPSYERRINTVTMENKVTGLSKLVSHSGKRVPTWN